MNASQTVKSNEDFRTWWETEGSKTRPQANEDLEEFAYRITRTAWSNGAFKALKREQAQTP